MPKGLGDTSAGPDARAVPRSKPARRKIRTVLHEFKAGALRSSSGQRVTRRDQAVAIALSEGRRARRRRPGT